MKPEPSPSPHLKDGPVEIIKAMAKWNQPAVFQKWPDRHELGGDDFMLIAVRGKKRVAKVEREIRRLLQREKD